MITYKFPYKMGKDTLYDAIQGESFTPDNGKNVLACTGKKNVGA